MEAALPEFLPSFPSQIWVSDITFVTFFGDKKCDASHFGKNVTLSHTKMFFWLVTFFVTSFPKNVTFWPRRYKTFLNGKKCDDSTGTETCFSLPVSDLSLISEAWSGKAIWAKTDPKSWKDCPGAWAQLSFDNVTFCMRSRPYHNGYRYFFWVTYMPKSSTKSQPTNQPT